MQGRTAFTAKPNRYESSRLYWELSSCMKRGTSFIRLPKTSCLQSLADLNKAGSNWWRCNNR